MRLELPPGAAPSDVQVFTVSGTWTMPNSASAVQVALIAGGGGGAPGGTGYTPGDFVSGGGGGTGAGWVTATFPAVALPATIPVVVGVGGFSVDLGSGIYDTSNDATASTFGDLLRAWKGERGRLSATGVYHEGIAKAPGSMIQPTDGGPPGWTGDAAGYAPDAFQPGCRGGGGGGSIRTTGATGDGGDGYSAMTTNVFDFAAGGVAPGGNGGNGQDADPNLPGPGVAGAGGASSTTGNGGNGGNGGRYGTGGGGGGAAMDPYYPGMGGAGGPGLVVVTTFF